MKSWDSINQCSDYAGGWVTEGLFPQGMKLTTDLHIVSPMSLYDVHRGNITFFILHLMEKCALISAVGNTDLGYMLDVQNALTGKSIEKHASVQVFTVQYSQDGIVDGDAPP